MKTKAEAEAWIASLKPGDKVIQAETGCGSELGSPMAVLTIKKVTATGIVRTEEGLSFQQNRYSSLAYVCGHGGTNGAIVPYDYALAEKAEECQRKKQAAEEERRILRDAKNICWEIAYGKKPLSLSLAKTIIKSYKEKNNE